MSADVTEGRAPKANKVRKGKSAYSDFFDGATTPRVAQVASRTIDQAMVLYNKDSPPMVGGIFRREPKYDLRDALLKSGLKLRDPEVLDHINNGTLTPETILAEDLEKIMLLPVPAQHFGAPDMEITVLQHIMLTMAAKAMEGDLGASTQLASWFAYKNTKRVEVTSKNGRELDPTMIKMMREMGLNVEGLASQPGVTIIDVTPENDDYDVGPVDPLVENFLEN